jgi:hypothetical protein
MPKHYRETHPDEPFKFICNICGKGYFKIVSLEMHLKNKHND